MVVLLIGGESSLMDALITKLNKNGHRVYLLTGGKTDRSAYKRVFEKYDFSYSSESVTNIIEGVRPDIMIFTGAFDTNYGWSNNGAESVRYTSDLINLLTGFSSLKQGRFVYFSYHGVFETSYAGNISEEESVSVRSYHGMAAAQGEEICLNYRKLFGMDTMILRFDHLYAIPKNGRQEDSPCFKKCLEALQTGKIQANERNTFSMIHLNDAVEYAYQIMMKQTPEYPVYHITSMEEINEKQLAALIRSAFGGNVEIVDTTSAKAYRTVLDGQRYRAEFPADTFVPYKKGVAEYARFMKENGRSFVSAETRGDWRGKLWQSLRGIGKALVPFIENLLCFLPFYLLDRQAAGSQYFAKLDFTLLYVLLFAAIHGQQQAVFSAVLSIIGFFTRQLDAQGVFSLFIDYSTYVWMAQLLIVGLVVGHMRDQLRRIREENLRNVEYLKNQLEEIKDINASNARIKQIYKTELVNQRDSLGQIYAITSELDRHEPEEVLFYVPDSLTKLMSSKDAAIYSVANQDYARLISATSQTARQLGISFKYSAMEDLSQDLLAHRVYVNRKLDSKRPAMAVGVFEEDRIQLILLLWNIPWERMILAEANRLEIFSRLMQNKVTQANRLLEARRSSRYEGDTNVLNQTEFSRLVHAMMEARSKHLVECALLEVFVDDSGAKEAAKVLGKKLYGTDYLGIMDNGRLYVLLTNTNDDQAKVIVKKLENCGYSSQIRKELESNADALISFQHSDG